MWLCPNCGHRFVTANIWHSCSRHTLDELFARAAPNVRASFDHWAELAGRCGPLVVIPQRTRIVFMGQVRFGGAQVRRDHLIASFALTRLVDDPRFAHQTYGPRWIAHRFRVRDPVELDDPLLAQLVCESYRDLGQRASLRRGPG
jgi:hypothetical protein